MKKRTTAAAAALVAAVFLTIAQAPAANAWEVVSTTFTASDYSGNTKVGSLKANGYACKLSVPKQGYKVKAYVKVTQSSVSSPASKPVRASLRPSGLSSAVGPYVAASVGKISTTPYLSGYLGANDSLTLSLISSELRTNGTVGFTVSELSAC
jgi:hypothetical protein